MPIAITSLPVALALAGALPTAAAAAPEPPPVLTNAPVVEAAPAPAPFHKTRAFLQVGALLALDTGWYEWQIELNKQDFDFARSVDGQWRRLATPAGHRFDDNERYLNVGHAFIGATYYQIARAHGAGLLTSTLFNIGASSAWELAVEHREVVSVNDQIVTGIGGVPIGEALFRASEVFARGRPTVRNRILAGVLAPMRLGAWAMGEAPSGSGLYDRGGLDASVAHRFDLALGGVAAEGAWVANARLDLEVIALPLAAAAEDADGGPVETVRRARLRGGEMTRFVADWAGTGDSMRAFELTARTTLFGLSDSRRRGSTASARVLAAASAFDLSYDRPGGAGDFFTLAHLAGPTADFAWSRERLALRAVVSAYGDFAMVRPMAVGPAGAPDLMEGAKSTLRRFDYYYGWGGTAALRLEASYRDFRAGAAAEWNHVDSIEGLDRHQDAYVSPVGVPHAAITDDTNLTDDRIKARAFLEAPVPFVDNLRVGVTGTLVHRRGTWAAHELTDAGDDLRVGFALSASL